MWAASWQTNRELPDRQIYLKCISGNMADLTHAPAGCRYVDEGFLIDVRYGPSEILHINELKFV